MTGEAYAFFRWVTWVWQEHPDAQAHGWQCQTCREAWMEYR